ncbi:hypothetical protein KNV05_gp196 [Vibrio phage River4]|uniref:PD(D/E)XK endonuclease domain-containing protein n=1 Tax=Vibrio phage River4 TaxID=2736288 RepID=A0A6M9Z402_9CAUD|nr:hypothetical protein KNV05_gp196 [Vibrio phage River4]QKN84759.1 hypothetical protein RIVER4_105 [Vibrio phage River4]
MFKNANTPKQQGDIGEAAAILVFTKLGYIVSKPLVDNSPYDLIVDNGDGLKRVQVKTSTRTRNGKAFEVKLETCGRTTKQHYSKARKDGDYDLLFVLLGDGRQFAIPETALSGAASSINVGHTKYNEFEV